MVTDRKYVSHIFPSSNKQNDLIYFNFDLILDMGRTCFQYLPEDIKRGNDTVEIFTV